MKKVFLGWLCVCSLGVASFALSRVYVYNNRHAILAARERIERELLSRPESEDTPLAFRKEYKDKHRKSQSS